MKVKGEKDHRELLRVAKAIAGKLKSNSHGTPLAIRMPTAAPTSNTDGWYVVIGNLGPKQPRLEVWFDRFSGYPERKFWACFHSEQRRQITSITKRVSKNLWPIKDITTADTTNEGSISLFKRLKRDEFNKPILEQYADGRTFFGIYDQTLKTNSEVNCPFVNRAVAFFEDVARCLPYANAHDEHRDVYPQVENRVRVVSHLQRERSRLLANDRKKLDKYTCQVCGFRFARRYGKLGEGFAEAHHIVPLSKLRKQVRSEVEDLRTVCSNCHRMLHKMNGERDDIKRLKSIVQRNRG